MAPFTTQELAIVGEIVERFNLIFVSYAHSLFTVCKKK